MYGAEAVILNLARTLKEGPDSCVLGVFSNTSNLNLELHEIAKSEGIESHTIPCKGQIDRKAITRIRELAKREVADIVHAHGYKADIYAYVAMRASGVPLVSTCHNWIDNDRKTGLYGFLDRLILRRYAQVVSVSEDVRQRLLGSGVNSHKIRMIRNGIDLQPFDGAFAVVKEELGWNGCLLVGLIGRLSPEKGVDIFMHAAARVLVECPDAKFIVAGDGPDRSGLDALIDKLRISESVRLLGRRNDMPALYASLDVMVSASRREGLPIAILEGMASRLPVVATAVGEVPSVIQPGRTGALVPPENPESLAAAIKTLLQDSVRREKLGDAAKLLIQKEYSAARMTAEYLRVYEEAITLASKGNHRHIYSSVSPHGTSPSATNS